VVGSGDIALRILNIGSRCEWSTSRPSLLPSDQKSPYTLDRRLDEPQNKPGGEGKKVTLTAPAGNRALDSPPRSRFIVLKVYTVVFKVSSFLPFLSFLFPIFRSLLAADSPPRFSVVTCCFTMMFRFHCTDGASPVLITVVLFLGRYDREYPLVQLVFMVQQ
jgi:hypothetical protein